MEHSVQSYWHNLQYFEGIWGGWFVIECAAVFWEQWLEGDFWTRGDNLQVFASFLGDSLIRAQKVLYIPGQERHRVLRETARSDKTDWVHVQSLAGHEFPWEHVKVNYRAVIQGLGEHVLHECKFHEQAQRRHRCRVEIHWTSKWRCSARVLPAHS